MKRKAHLRRPLAILLSLLILVSVMPLNVWAADGEIAEASQLEASANTVDAEELRLGEDFTADIAQGGDEAFFSFIPDQTDLYRFSSATDIDTYGTLYDEEMTVLAENDDGEDANFRVEYVLTAGVVYFFGAKCADAEQIGEFPVRLEIIHSYTSDVADATCAEDGVETFTCEYCGDSYEETIPATGHDYVEDVVEPTCTEDGEVTYTCLNCGDSYTNTLPSFGHDFVDGVCTQCGELENHDEPEDPAEPENPADPENPEEQENTQIPENATELQLDMPATAVISEPGEYAYFSFTPDTDECYGIYAQSNGYPLPMLFLYNSEMQQLRSGESMPECVELAYDLVAGTTYYIGLCFPGENTGDFSITLKVYHAFDVEYTPATCIEEGEYIYTCRYCGYSFTRVTDKSRHQYVDHVCEVCGAVAESSGACGENAVWTYDDDTHTLTVSGSGSMESYGTDATPWIAFRQDIQTVVIDEGITNTGMHAFFECTNLSSVSLPSSLKEIDYWAFIDCVNLTTIAIPDSVEYIGAHAFQGTGLTDISLPSGIKTIEEMAVGYSGWDSDDKVEGFTIHGYSKATPTVLRSGMRKRTGLHLTRWARL